jgi:hypothetical protein
VSSHGEGVRHPGEVVAEQRVASARNRRCEGCRYGQGQGRVASLTSSPLNLRQTNLCPWRRCVLEMCRIRSVLAYLLSSISPLPLCPAPLLLTDR